MDLGISGRYALVCGASRGLGFGCAQTLSREGVHVLLVARGFEALDIAVDRLRQDPLVPRGTQVQGLVADVTEPQGRAAIFGRLMEFDILITNAGGPPAGDFRQWGRDAWLRAIDANMLAPIELMKGMVDAMASRKFGRVLNITSTAVKAPIDVLGLSNGARSGLTGFVAGLARTEHLAANNVTINNLLPGYFDTGRMHATLEAKARDAGLPVQEVASSHLEAIPARRFGTAKEFGALCAFLCSTHAAYITGQNLLIDGGGYPGTF